MGVKFVELLIKYIVLFMLLYMNAGASVLDWRNNVTDAVFPFAHVLS